MNISGVNGSGAIAYVPVAEAGSRRSVPSQQGQAAQHAEAGREEIKQMVDKMQRQVDSMSVSLTFSPYGDGGEKIAIIVANKETGKVIREIPAKEIQHLYSKMSELTGMILNGGA